MQLRRFAIALLAPALLAFPTFAADDSGEPTWQSVVQQRLPSFGEGNLIVIADSSFPELSLDSVQTICTRTPQLDVLKGVLAAIDGNKHLHPVIATTSELKFVAEQDAPGISSYRDSLFKLLADRDLRTIKPNDHARSVVTTATVFRVLVLKTDSTLPFTSVFIQLGNGYWSVDADKRLRDSMAGDESK